MSLANVLHRAMSRSTLSRRPQQTVRKPARQGRSFVPWLELLEDRTVLSTLTVTSSGDSGDGSLRAILAAAQSGDQIVFDSRLRGQITLTGGELAITKDLDIEGPGADNLAVSGNHGSRIFAISGSATVTIAGLTITDGRIVGGEGGGILISGGTLILAHDVLSHNQSIGVSSREASGGPSKMAALSSSVTAGSPRTRL
jgi:hypothetical protein